MTPRQRLVTAAVALVAPSVMLHEGLRLDSYPDVGGVWTICYGSTTIDMQPVRPGQKATRAVCDRALYADLSAAANAASRAVYVPLTTEQLAAITSFTYNVGQGKLKSSTLLRKLNAGDYCGASAEFQRWAYVRGKRYDGLYTRRTAEQSLFMKGTNLPCSSPSKP